MGETVFGILQIDREIRNTKDYIFIIKDVASWQVVVPLHERVPYF